jgi:hypothetical protein
MTKTGGYAHAVDTFSDSVASSSGGNGNDGKFGDG